MYIINWPTDIPFSSFSFWFLQVSPFPPQWELLLKRKKIKQTLAQATCAKHHLVLRLCMPSRSSLHPLTLSLKSLQKLGVNFAKEVNHLGFGRSSRTASRRSPHTPSPAGFLFIRVWRSTSSASDGHDHWWNLLVGQEHPLHTLQHIVENDQSPKCLLQISFFLSKSLTVNTKMKWAVDRKR